MKKISKFLLPLSAVAATTAAVTPLVACGGNTVDLFKYSPDPTSRHAKGALTKQQAADALFGGDNALELVKQDILTYLSWELENEVTLALAWAEIDWVGHINKATATLSNLKLTYDSSKMTARLSGSIKLKAVCTMIKSKDETQKIGTYTLETEHTLTNMPYTMTYDNVTYLGLYNYWTSYFTKDMLQNDTSWSAKVSYLAEAKYTIKHDDEQEEKNVEYNSTKTLDDKAMEILSMVRWWSYYLWETWEDSSK